MSCEYGCSTEATDDKCTRCGHPKGDHHPVHPHQCQGEYDKEHVHVLKSCKCIGFTRSNPHVGTGI